MAKVSQAIFDDLLSQGAIAADGTIQSRIFCNGTELFVTDEPLTVEKSAPQIAVPAPTVEAPKSDEEKQPTKPATTRTAKPKGGDQ